MMLLKVYPAHFSKSFLRSTLIFIVFNLISGFSVGIDNAAHFGGVISGAIIGLILSQTVKQAFDDEEEEVQKEPL